ncbi:MAG: S8 family serine peptidase [Pyrinomonadaceae bacterium]
MKSGNSKRLAAVFTCVVLVSFALAPATAQKGHQEKWNYPEIPPDLSKRGAEPTDKLAPELRILFEQFTSPTRGGNAQVFSRGQLKDLFGIQSDGGNPTVGVSITLAGGSDPIAPLKNEGARVYFRSGTTVYADVPVQALVKVARQQNVTSITTAKAASVPTPPQPSAPPAVESLPGLERGGSPPPSAKVDSDFNRQGLTGKGVIVGIVDTGIDWTHKDFIRPDGTSRILYIWDQKDTSFADSHGKIGSAPPTLIGGDAPGPGTLYTNEQINAALKGRDTVNSMDNYGHGTAAASTAAGNGLATANGVLPGTYAGAAPEADLIIVKAADCGGFSWHYILGTIWIAQKARELGLPAVINHSLGGHFTAHDGREQKEQIMNDLVGAGKAGLAITVSAGNEGQLSMHASGRFGPHRPDQRDFVGAPIEVYVSPQRTENLALITAYFDRADDWGLILVGSGNFLVDEKGNPLRCYIYKHKDTVAVQLDKGAKKPSYFDEFAERIKQENTQLALPGGPWDQLLLLLPPGGYWLMGFGSSENVKSGRFDLYGPDTNNAPALFTFGAEKRRMVGSPGNAANVITVGAYDFRGSWANIDGRQTLYNLSLSGISDYSSPGGLRSDGVFKPDIAAPASYTISSLSRAATPDGSGCEGENMGSGSGPTSVTRDGFHIAWEGTSAAAPFAAGVIALMLQKNPKLDAQQIKNILTSTAIRNDRYVGAVPNSEWGYGKINPTSAITAISGPAGKPVRPRRRR